MLSQRQLSIIYIVVHQCNHFIPDSNGVAVKTCTPQGYVLNFTFIQGDGTPADFGTNSTTVRGKILEGENFGESMLLKLLARKNLANLPAVNQKILLVSRLVA